MSELTPEQREAWTDRFWAAYPSLITWQNNLMARLLGELVEEW